MTRIIDCGGFVGSPIYLRGNSIYDPRRNALYPRRQGGDMTVLDNTIASLSGASGGVVVLGRRQ